MVPDLLLEVQDLRVHFPVYGGLLSRRIGEVRAVDGISFRLRRGETFGLVGESGCGKTTVGKAVLNLVRPASGSVFFTPPGGEPVDLASLTRSGMRPLRAHIQMIFQDPYSSLNPRLSVSEIMSEPLRIHFPAMTPAERAERVAWLLGKVGLPPEAAAGCPHEFSGGQRQRIGIARALATRPSLIIADEPVSALDVSIQAQVLNLLQDLQEEFGLTTLFIAHDLSVVEHVCDRIAVMYLGSIVETGPAAEVFRAPLHPYTRALLSAIPRPSPGTPRRERILLTGEVPSALNQPSGCGFRTRCPIARPACAESRPALAERAPGHSAACPYST
ncbi:MAG: peptide ABC transporter ATP-binding protein [Elusimicrobia bacterium GWA2_69_24]|nr:MAG: peptide ABC transporter ATP-binding protein [Elusimicrobia bacterium GWA2_69_24]HBL15382.1 peptide ABC transporter ATP-binding protein [Elusimicrobiota bacterium]